MSRCPSPVAKSPTNKSSGLALLWTPVSHYLHDVGPTGRVYLVAVTMTKRLDSPIIFLCIWS